MFENQLRELGKTGLKFYPMGLGTASFSGVNMTGSNKYQKPSEEQIDKLINSAIIETKASENNKLIIDTSSQYGESELRIGNYIKNNHNKIKDIYICTKWGLKFKSEDFAVQDYSLKNLKESLENSFKLLSKIDLYYIHTNPSVKPDVLKSILGENNEIINYFKAIKERKFEIKHLGISVSSEENLKFLIENKFLLKEIDVLQINADILLKNPKIARLLEYLDIGIIVNSIYRKGDLAKRDSQKGLQEIFSEVLDINKNIIILTGTSSIQHLKENFNYIKNHIEDDNIKISFYSQNLPPATILKVNKDLSSYFKIFNEKKSNLQSNYSKNLTNDNDLVINNIIDMLIGSLKTRIGAAPDESQRKILHNIVKFYVNESLPIDTILTWGPKKFFTGTEEEGYIDLSEILSFQTLILLSNNIKSIYPPSLRFYIFIEDFEGKFIEGNYLHDIFDSYISELEKLIKILRINSIVRIIRTQELILVNYNLEQLTDQLKKNYVCLREYWLESEKIGINNSEKLESYKKIQELGWFEKIGDDTRDYYLGRLNRILGDTKTHHEKVDMTVRLLACVLMHRQYNLLKVNNKSEAVKLSFLKISGGPKKLMNGRIDIRTIQSNISKKHLSPWTAKGCLRIKNDKVLPVLKRYRELKEIHKNFNNAEVNLENFNLKMQFKTSYLDE
jgi:aryl-alcohol dehydrogenase-like predicted oxidoreductase